MIRWTVVGLLAGIIPGLWMAIVEECVAGAHPNNAFEIGSIVATSTLGLLTGLIASAVMKSNGEEPH